MMPRLTGGWPVLPSVRDCSLVIPPQLLLLLLQGTRCVGFKRLVKKKTAAGCTKRTKIPGLSK